MATRTQSSSASFVKADAFLNISVVAADGSVHRLRKGIPLHTDNSLERSLINAMKSDPDLVLQVTADVLVVTEDNGEDIAF